MNGLGLRLDNPRAAALRACAPVALAVGVPLAAGAALSTWHFEPVKLALEIPWHLAWGTAQQYGLLCLLYRRSLDVLGNSWSAALFAASAFALFHLPNPFLIGVTFLAGSITHELRVGPGYFTAATETPRVN